MINPFPSSLLAPYNTSITFLQRTYATLSCHDVLASCICDVAVILYTHLTHFQSYGLRHGLLRLLISHARIALSIYSTIALLSRHPNTRNDTIVIAANRPA